MTYFGQFHDDPYFMTAEEEKAMLQARDSREAFSSYCKCSFTDPDGTVVPGEPCELHPEVKP